jgi:hypothetical protein
VQNLGGLREGIVGAAVAAAYFGGQVAFGERNPVNGGLRWDGLAYGSFASDLPGAVLHRAVPAYYVGRLLPSAIVWLAVHALGLDLNSSTSSIVTVFSIYNAVVLLGAVFAWTRITQVLVLPSSVAWLGSVALFVNFPVLKLYSFFPVQTDASALALGVLIALLIVEKRLGCSLCVGWSVRSSGMAHFWFAPLPSFFRAAPSYGGRRSNGEPIWRSSRR